MEKAALTAAAAVAATAATSKASGGGGGAGDGGGDKPNEGGLDEHKMHAEVSMGASSEGRACAWFEG